MVWIVIILTAIVTVMSLAAFIPIPHGIARVWDFPRIHILTFATILFAVTPAIVGWGPLLWVLLLLQFVVMAVQSWTCLHYTGLWTPQSISVGKSMESYQTVRIVTANVKMSNRAYDRLVRVIEREDPDIAIFLEVDKAWTRALAKLKGRLPFVIEQPQDNSFGLLVLSRLRLRETRLRFRVLPGVPSIMTAVLFPDGQRFRLHIVHPEPPVPHIDTLGRDAELILTAHDVLEDDLPAIVTGDMNDVAWSHTTRRFQRISGLLDPRVGRGFFNSFHADHVWARWPLDHLFHDPRFRLVRLERLEHVGSDHFPMLFEVALAREEAVGSEPGNANGADKDEADDVVSEAETLDRKPVGGDWEQ